MDKRAIVVLSVVFGGLFLTFFGFLLLAMSAMDGGGGGLGSGPKIGVVEIVDEIMDSKQTLEELKSFRDDKSIKAVVVRVNSPGGAVGPSQEIHDAIVETRKKKKVVVSMGNVAASGGFYLAVAGDEIIANAGTITGSIGVITQFTDLRGVAEWAKVDFKTFTSGKFKDSGSSFREMRDDEKEYWRSLVMNIYDQFLTAVATGRGLEKDLVKPYADGRVLTGQQALEAGLVDHLGNFDFAVARAAELAGLEGEPKVIYPEKAEDEILREILSGAMSEAASGLMKGAAEGVGKASIDVNQPRFLLMATAP